MKALRWVMVVAVAVVCGSAHAEERITFKDVAQLDVQIDPPKAKPGQTVTWRLTMTVKDGWHTYPNKQPPKYQDAITTNLKFDDSEEIIFVGEMKEQANSVEVTEDGKPMLE